MARPRHDGPRFDARALVALYGDISTVGDALGVEVRTVHRWLEEGLTWQKADALAVAAGRHPASLWGWSWVDAALSDKRAPSEIEQLPMQLEWKETNR